MAGWNLQHLVECFRESVSFIVKVFKELMKRNSPDHLAAHMKAAVHLCYKDIHLFNKYNYVETGRKCLKLHELDPGSTSNLKAFTTLVQKQ